MGEGSVARAEAPAAQAETSLFSPENEAFTSTATQDWRQASDGPKAKAQEAKTV